MFQPQATNTPAHPPRQTAEVPAQSAAEPSSAVPVAEAAPAADQAPAAEPAPAATEPRSRPKQRDPFFDNAKYLAIVLVAMGHSWERLLSESRTAEALYSVVYAFHMPAFIIISGYFSRSFTGR